MRSLIPSRSSSDWFSDLRKQLDDTFTRFLTPMEQEAGNSGALMVWAPRVDVEETESALLVKADLPGVKPEEVEITVSHEGTLILRGERKEEKKEEKKNYWRTERFVGQFYREIPLPAGTDPEKVEASITDGVITVTVPKKPEAKPKKVLVKPKASK
jgi:HSP20 family protein